MKKLVAFYLIGGACHGQRHDHEATVGIPLPQTLSIPRSHIPDGQSLVSDMDLFEYYHVKSMKVGDREFLFGIHQKLDPRLALAIAHREAKMVMKVEEMQATIDGLQIQGEEEVEPESEKSSDPGSLQAPD